jgi:hypothetical protein
MTTRFSALGRGTLIVLIEALVIAALTITMIGLTAPAGDLPGVQIAAAARPDAGTSATLTVTPNPVAAGGATYVVTGSGYKVGTFVAIQLYEPGCCRFFSIMPDANGNIAFAATTVGPGTYKVEARQRLGGRKTTLVGTATFTVQ